MERNMKVRRSSMFLLELMITILLFSVTSAVCIRVFAQAHAESEQARVLTEATGACSNAAELIRSAASPEEGLWLLEDNLAPGRLDGHLLIIPQADNARMEIHYSVEHNLHLAEIRYLTQSGDCVYSLEVSRYFPEVIA